MKKKGKPVLRLAISVLFGLEAFSPTMATPFASMADSGSNIFSMIDAAAASAGSVAATVLPGSNPRGAV